MKNSILCILILWGCFQFVQGQEFQGRAIYQSKTSVDINFGGREMSEAQRQRIKERMKNALEKTYTLNFDRTSSLYEEEEKLEQPGGANGRGFRFGAFGGSGKYYKNIKDQEYRNQMEMFGKIFLIKDHLPKLEWKLGSETKKIGKYTCYKATAMKPLDATDFSNFRRRRNQERPTENKEEAKKDSTAKRTALFSQAEVPKEVEITAWYTTDIPISQGPGEYWGLPGLILEVNAGRTAILCSKIVMNPEDKTGIEPPSKGKEVDQKEYNKILQQKMEEMSERFRRGDRGGNRNFRN